MPFIYRRGRLWLGRESATYGTGATLANALAGITAGPLAGFSTSTLGNQANVPGIVIPTLSRDLEAMFGKHQSPMQVGRKFEDVAMVPGRRNGQGSFQVEITPDVFTVLAWLTMGADAVTATGSTTTTGTNNANATTLNVVTGLPALSDGQYIWISDGANTEYVQVNGNQAANTLAIPIKGGSGTGGGLKFTHTTGLTVQVGPWTHVITPSAGSPGAGQLEDNWGGAATSLLYKGLIFDAMDLAFPIENDTAAATATIKVLGMAPSATPVTASAVPTGIPIEEVPIAAGNAPVVTVTGGTDSTINVADFKLSIANNAKIAKGQVSAPDPYAALATNWSARGSMETFFEDYGVYQDFANNLIWSPVVLTYTWPSQLLPSGGGGAKVAASIAFSMQRLAIEKAGKEVMKEDLVRLPIEAFRCEDYSDFSSPLTITVKSNLASV